GARVFEHVLVIALGVGGVGRRGDTARGHDREVGDRPLGAVFGHQHDAVAGFEPEAAQRFRQQAHPSRRLGPAQRLPGAVLDGCQERSFAELVGAIEEQAHEVRRGREIRQLQGQRLHPKSGRFAGSAYASGLRRARAALKGRLLRTARGTPTYSPIAAPSLRGSAAPVQPAGVRWAPLVLSGRLRAPTCAWPSACNCGIIASSAEPCSTVRASPGANSTGSAIASASGRPKSITPINARATCTGIVAPPAAPTASTSSPSAS